MANRKARHNLHVLTISDLQKEASKKLPLLYNQYFNEGAGDMTTLRDNEESYNRYKLRPRVLKDVDGCDLSTEIFGTKVGAPFGFAPAAAHQIAHPDGELAASRAAATNNLPLCLSSWATFSLEDVKAAGGKSNPYAMQVTFLRDIAITQSVIKRAERAGYKAIFVSVDLPVLGNRLNESRNNFTFPATMPFPNLPSAFASSSSSSSPSPSDETQEQKPRPVSTDSLDYDPSINWARTIPWLRHQTAASGMQIWLKGVTTPEDVELAISFGLDGVVISNHGGRQLDGVPSTLDALRDCARVAFCPATGKHRIQMAVDGGIRRGSDIFKALALGAQFVFIGRPVIWGLAYDGENGVDLACKILVDELRSTMMLCGCRTIADIGRGHLSVLNAEGVLAKL